jgi:hypothetical protein
MGDWFQETWKQQKETVMRDEQVLHNDVLEDVHPDTYVNALILKIENVMFELQNVAVSLRIEKDKEQYTVSDKIHYLEDMGSDSVSTIIKNYERALAALESCYEKNFPCMTHEEFLETGLRKRSLKAKANSTVLALQHYVKAMEITNVDERIAGYHKALGERVIRTRAIATSQNSIIREWAQARGLPVSDRGRISKEIQDKYCAEHDVDTYCAEHVAE